MCRFAATACRCRAPFALNLAALKRVWKGRSMHSARTLNSSAAAFAPVLLASLLTVGCGLFQQSSPKVAAVAPPASAPVQQIQPSASAPERHVGDLFVHRFSGSFA